MKLIAIILSIVISFTNGSLCFADSSNVKNFKFENDIKMSGVISSTGKFFDCNKNWNIKNAKLNLIFTKSEILDVNYSTITIFINDTPIESQRLSGKKEYKKESTIEIPIDLIKEGYNEIKIKAYKTISDQICRDDSNTANWLVVHKESNINLEYDYKKSSNNISEYPNSYVNIDSGTALNTTILVPDKFSSGELSAGMIISADFGKKRKYENFHVDFKVYSDFKEQKNNTIYVGKADNTPKEILGLFSDSEKADLDNTCLIKQVSSSANNSVKRLFIISNNEELLVKGAQLLTSSDLVLEVNQDSIIIDKNTDVRDLDKKKVSNRMYLKELGYENIMVKGPFSQEVIMDINTPKSKKVVNGSNLKFNLRYAQNLDYERSLVTIYINDIPIGSKKLSKDKSNHDVVELSLPKEVVDKNYYQIKVVFNLELLDVACVTRDTDNPWAYISNESFVEFAYNDNKELSFKNYPYPFVDDEKFNNTKVIIPSNSSSRELTNIANIVAYIGREVNLNDGNLLVVKDKDISEKEIKGNIIIIGTPKDNKFVKNINNSLNLKFRENYNGFESNDKIKFVGNYASQIAGIQLIQSPYDKEYGAMIVSSVDITDLSLSSKYLSDIGLTKGLKGDTVVIGRDGSLQDLNYKIKEETDTEKVESKKELSNKSKIFIVVAIFLFITVIISIVFLAKKYKR